MSGEPVRVLAGHSSHVHGATFSADGTRVATASQDGTVRLWRLDRVAEPEVIRIGPSDSRVEWDAFSPDSARLAVAAPGNDLLLLASDGGGVPLHVPHPQHVRRARFSPDGARLVTVSGKVARLFAAGIPLNRSITNGRPRGGSPCRTSCRRSRRLAGC